MKDLEDMLKNTDFSLESSNRDDIKAKLKAAAEEHKNDQTGEIYMKKRHFKPIFVIAAALTLTLGLGAVAYGDGLIRIIKDFTVGKHAAYLVVDNSVSSHVIPSEVRGQLFDADGNELSEFPEDREAMEMYNADGEPATIVYEQNENGTPRVYVETVEEVERARAEHMETMHTYFETLDDAKQYLAFEPLMPSALPDGFAIDRIALFNDEGGSPGPLGSSKYLSVYYANAGNTQQIYMQLRLMDDETGFVSSASPEMREITVNGRKGVLDGKNIDVEIDDVMYMIMAGSCDSVSQKDVIRMAESLK